MPLLSHDKAIYEYWLEVRDKYPDISFEKFEIICKSPFQAIKAWIKKGDLPIIMIKYLGKLKVYPSKIKDMLKVNEIKFNRGEKTQAEYDYNKNFLEGYLEDLKNEPTDIDLIDDQTDTNEF